MSMAICRYKLLSLKTGKQFSVFWLYFGSALILFLMCTAISVYLFRTLVHVGLRGVLANFGLFLGMKGLFQMKFKSHLLYSYKWLWIKYSHLTIGVSSMKTGLLFGLEMELAYSHRLLFRLFCGLMGMNPLFLLVSLCMSLVFGISSFYYEYSCLSILGKLSCYSIGGQIA